MGRTEADVSTGLVVLFLVPVAVAVLVMGSVVYGNLAVGQPAGGPGAGVVISDHPDRVERSAVGEGIVTGTLQGDSSVPWSSVVVEVVDPRSRAVVLSLSAPSWSATGAGQTIELHVDGAVPESGGAFAPGETFVVREVADDTDGSADLVHECDSYVFRVRHPPTGTDLGSYETTFVTADWAPGHPCVP